jgi:hypothetical protein
MLREEDAAIHLEIFLTSHLVQLEIIVFAIEFVAQA